MATSDGMLTILFGAFVLVVVSLFFGFLCVVANTSRRKVDILCDDVFFDCAPSIHDQVDIVEFVGIMANAVFIYLIDGDDDGDDCRKRSLAPRHGARTGFTQTHVL